MANFSSFFPVAAAGGGGGFTKMLKYSTNNSSDANYKLKQDVSGKVGQSISGGGQTSFQWQSDDISTYLQALSQDGLVGYTFNIGYGVQTVTANAGGDYGTNQLLSFTPAVAGGVSSNTVCDLIAPTSFTVNPSSDLGLSDGDSIGYLLAGGNATGVLRGTAIISSASTDLVLTPGVSSGTASTISGGLTLTSADGTLSNSIGYLNTVENSGYSSFMRTRVAAGQGIDGYGVGQQFSGTQTDGYGGYGKDGAVLLFY